MAQDQEVPVDVRGPAPLVQYWRSADALERVAFDATSRTVDVWRAWFGTGDGTGGRAGFWHETFQVRAGEYECIYGNMPRSGLANAGEHRGLGSASRARERMSV